MLKSMVHFEGWCRKKGALFSVSYIMTPEKAQTIHETSILCTSFDPIKNQPFIWGKYTCPMDDIREVSLMFFELYFLRVKLGPNASSKGLQTYEVFFGDFKFRDRFWAPRRFGGQESLQPFEKTSRELTIPNKKAMKNCQVPFCFWCAIFVIARLENRVNACRCNDLYERRGPGKSGIYRYFEVCFVDRKCSSPTFVFKDRTSDLISSCARMSFTHC